MSAKVICWFLIITIRTCDSSAMTLVINPRLLALTSIFFLGASSSICYPPFLRAEAQSGSSANQFTVPNGQLTFDSEGLECPNLSDKCKSILRRQALAWRQESVGCGFKSQRQQRMFPSKSLLKWTCFIILLNYLNLYISVSHIIY